MYNLLLSEEHLKLRSEAREFAQKELAPFATEVDRRGPKKYCQDLMDKIAKKGYMGIPFPAEYGGMGRDFTSYVVVTEELATAYEALGPNMQGTMVGSYGVYYCGTEEQKKKMMPEMCAGKKNSAFGLVEWGAGSHTAGIQTEYTKDGDHFVINGRKAFISNAGVAYYYTIYAREKGTTGAKGISAFIVEKGTPGFSIGRIDEYMGLYGHITGELIMENCRVPKENLLGKEGDGFKVAMSTLEVGRVGECAQALALSRNCLKEATRWAKQRKQFGRPIADFQGVSFALADMATELEAGKLLVYHAARLIDQGIKPTKEASIAKLYTSDLATRCADRAVEILGARGLTKEYPVERYYRAAKFFSIVVGTSEIQRIVISRAVLNEY